MPTTPPNQIGRFQIQRALGSGAQGQVWLAHDPKLDRPVAIKTLKHRAQQSSSLLAEARHVSRLSHPGIVPVYDAEEAEGVPYLVFEYIEGQTLAAHLDERRALPALHAAQIASDVLDALAYAHQHGVLHRDIKPANILLTPAGEPRIMDFGIAIQIVGKGTIESGDFANSESSQANTPSGTVTYLAPECFDGDYSAQSDVYAVGMLLYEMLAGQAAYRAPNATQLIYQITQENLPALPASVDEVEPRLWQILLRASAKDKSLRYPTAEAFAQELNAYLNGESGLETTSANSTEKAANRPTNKAGAVAWLLRKMRLRSDFPALSGAIRAINRLSSAETESIGKLSDLLMKDFALHTKLLRLVNTANYSHFGGIASVSQAVMILGFDTVRAMAISLMLFEHMQNRKQADVLQEEVLRSLLSGSLARELCRTKWRNLAEQAFTTAVLQNLGMLLLKFYFYDEYEQILRLQQNSPRADGQKQQENDLADAATRVLGISLNELAQATTRSWNLPDRIVRAMEPIVPPPQKRPQDETQQLAWLASCANALRESIWQGLAAAEGVDEKAIAHIHQQYQVLMTDDVASLRQQMCQAISAFQQEVPELVTANATVLLQKLHAPAVLGSTQTNVTQTKSIQTLAGQTQRGLTQPLLVGNPMNGAQNHDFAALRSVVDFVQDKLVHEGSLMEMLKTTLQRIQQTAQFEHAVLLLRDPHAPECHAVQAYGPQAEVYRQHMHWVQSDDKDLFALLMRRKADVFIEDSHSPHVQQYLPSWFHQEIGSTSFLLMPLATEQKLLGAIYGDFGKNKTTLAAAQISILKTIRDLLLQGFKRRGA